MLDSRGVEIHVGDDVVNIGTGQIGYVKSFNESEGDYRVQWEGPMAKWRWCRPDELAVLARKQKPYE